MSARRVSSEDTVPGRLTGVDHICTLRLLEDAEVHVGLGHSPECRFQTSVPPVPDVVSAESNRHFFLRRTPSTLEHSPPTVDFFLPPSVSLLVSIRLSLRRSLSVPCLPCPSRPFPPSIRSPFPSRFHSVPLTLESCAP